MSLHGKGSRPSPYHPSPLPQPRLVPPSSILARAVANQSGVVVMPGASNHRLCKR
jgi:hypothetical protein